jgi:uncharacterized damage-inducible protein DinB
MLPILEAYFDRLTALHDGIILALEGLPPEALDWSPGEGMNTITVLVVHLTGAARYWVGDVAGHDPSDRDRDAEFRASGWDAAALRARLDETLAYCRETLSTLRHEDLDSLCMSPRDGKEYSAAWALFHALEHTALHAGHIQLTRQCREAAQG